MIVFEFMMEASMKPSFPWQVVKRSRRGLRMQVIKILEAAYGRHLAWFMTALVPIPVCILRRKCWI